MKTRRRIEFGDFQTPLSLADKVCRLLARRGVCPASIVEPACGIGNFVVAAADAFPRATNLLAIDVNAEHVAETRRRLQDVPRRADDLRHADFFDSDWPALFAPLPEPLLVIGNPPWVNNSEQGAIGGSNLPEKKNSAHARGIDAITGKSNFDISEWMLNRLVESLAGRRATLAMLCKTSVARKVLAQAWKHDHQRGAAEMWRIDAAAEFGASVDACLLICHFGIRGTARCDVYSKFDAQSPDGRFGARDDRLVADVDLYDKWRHLRGSSPHRWRSGIKHDCARVMELRRDGRRFVNGLGETIELEDEFLYPMLKSSQLAAGQTATASRWMIVPQRRVGDDTSVIRDRAPKTWRYLLAHADRLDRRGSSIYSKRPRFSVFGVGEYSFSRWKVAISGLYKKLQFCKVGCIDLKPTVLDDTCYFLPCRDEREADGLVSLLNSVPAGEFYSSLIFWDAKRPITAEILSLLDVAKLTRRS